jgi:hypothetical protein
MRFIPVVVGGFVSWRGFHELAGGSANSVHATSDSPVTKTLTADTNHDGKLTLEEVKAGMPRVAKVF